MRLKCFFVGNVFLFFLQLLMINQLLTTLQKDKRHVKRFYSHLFKTN